MVREALGVPMLNEKKETIKYIKTRDTVFSKALKEFTMSVENFDIEVGVKYTEAEELKIKKFREDRDRRFIGAREFRTVFNSKREG